MQQITTLAELLAEADRIVLDPASAPGWAQTRLPLLIEAVRAQNHAHALLACKMLGNTLPNVSDGARSHLKNILEEQADSLKR